MISYTMKQFRTYFPNDPPMINDSNNTEIWPVINQSINVKYNDY